MPDTGDCIYDAGQSAAGVGGLTYAAAGATCAGLQVLGLLGDLFTLGGTTVAATAACAAGAAAIAGTAAVTAGAVSAAKSAQGQRTCGGVPGQ